jgi:hypothetical protein
MKRFLLIACLVSASAIRLHAVCFPACVGLGATEAFEFELGERFDLSFGMGLDLTLVGLDLWLETTAGMYVHLYPFGRRPSTSSEDFS